MKQFTYRDIEFRYEGDFTACDALRGQGIRAIGILESLMSFRGLRQDSLTIIPYPGAIVTADKIFGKKVVTINIGGGISTQPTQESYCLCNCNFTFGYIDSVHSKTFEEEDFGEDATEEEKLTKIYDVLVCYGRRKFRKFSNILSSDFTIYEVGEKIMLVPYNESLFTCCTGVAVSTGCVPRISKNAANEDGFAKITDEEFLSTLRIIPWCGIKIQKFYQR